MADEIIQLEKTEYDYLKRLDEAANGGAFDMDDVVGMQKAARGGPSQRAKNYETFMDAYDTMKNSSNPKAQRAWSDANSRIKELLPGDVHTDASLSNVSIQYANEAYIGESLMPVVTVTKESDFYYVYPRGERMQYPDDAFGSRGKAPEITESRSTATYTTRPYGYSNFLPQRTLSNQDAPLDEMVDLMESINEALAYRRELRISAIMTDNANFPGQTAAIAAGDRWDTAGGGNPIKDLQDARKNIWRGKGPSDVWQYSSLDVFNVLSRHQGILDLFKYNGSSPGLATPSMMSRFFGVKGYLIGESRQNTAKEGLADVYSRMWGDVLGMVRVARRPTKRNASFGYTFRHGQALTSVKFEAQDGHGGGYTGQVSVAESHNIVASPTGYLLTTPIG